jgi:putative FmdB family regulatory protein
VPTYDRKCRACKTVFEVVVPIAERDAIQGCPTCGNDLTDRLLAAPLGRMAGVIPQGGGPDRFTADMLGIPLKELPSDLSVKRKSTV